MIPGNVEDGEVRELVSEMVAQRELFEQRARQWVASPAFEKVYDDLHPGLLVKTILTLLGKGRVVKKDSAKLRGRYRQLASRGELLFGAVIIGNTGMSEKPDARHAAALLASTGQDADAVIQTTHLADLIAEAYAMGGSPTLPQCSKLIADDSYQALRRRPLPMNETGGLPSALFDIRVSMNELLIDDAPSAIVPILVDPTNHHFAVAPWHVLLGLPEPEKKPVPPPLLSTPPASRTVPPPLRHETSPGGSAILRHQATQRGFEPAFGGDNLETIENHIERHLGPVYNVFHELISDQVHLDVHFVPPTSARPFHTLVTSGMSDRPMHVPPGAEEYQHAELMICLPPEWNLGQDGAGGASPTAFDDERNYWPIRWLKQLARLPHTYQTWLGPAHTIPNGDPAEPLADGLPFTGFLVVPPLLAPDEFSQLQTADGKIIHFHAIIPLTTREMDFKLTHGTSALFEQLSAHGVSELVNPHRESVV